MGCRDLTGEENKGIRLYVKLIGLMGHAQGFKPPH